MRAALLTILLCSAVISAQSAKTYRARLSPVPIDVTMQATVAGSGAVTATLAGAKLTINGTFDGLKSAATTAAIHKSPVRGVRGPEMFPLKVTAAGMGGTIGATIDLTAAQVTDLEKGRFYVQLQSEKAPEGNLWGWLLLQEKR
jgi:hypothetical protein